MIDFGTKLRQLRKERNLTQKQLAALIGVKGSVISFYEVGDRLPSPEVIRKLALELHVSADYLLGIRRNETIDVSGLSESEISLIRAFIEAFRQRQLNS